MNHYIRTDLKADYQNIFVQICSFNLEIYSIVMYTIKISTILIINKI